MICFLCLAILNADGNELEGKDADVNMLSYAKDVVLFESQMSGTAFGYPMRMEIPLMAFSVPTKSGINRSRLHFKWIVHLLPRLNTECTKRTCLYILALLQNYSEDKKALSFIQSTPGFKKTVQEFIADAGKERNEECMSAKKLLHLWDGLSQESTGDGLLPKKVQVMISYAWGMGEASKNRAREVADFMDKKGFKVWLDLNEMKGSIKWLWSKLWILVMFCWCCSMTHMRCPKPVRRS